MKIRRIDHISVAVENLDSSRLVWEPILGKSGPDELYVHEPENIRVARYLVGNVGLELMESTSPHGPVAKWIKAHGEGLMVLSLNVQDTREAVAELEPRGYPFVTSAAGDKLRPFRGCEFAFIHPRKVNGVLLEIIDDKEGASG